MDARLRGHDDEGKARIILPRHSRESGNPACVTVLLPAPFATLFPGSERRVEVSGSTVAEAIDALNARWPGMRDRICDSTPGIRRHIRIFVDGERATLQTELAPASEVLVMTAISGG